MACDAEDFNRIEACRTCGVYYTVGHYLRPLFRSSYDNLDMMLIRMELAQWQIEVSESDGLPQYMCTSCIHEFQNVFKFRKACRDNQEQLRELYNIRAKNLANIKIKTEILDDGPRCDFVYVDDFSDGEYESVTPFNFPHVPIKTELIEAATVPQDNDQINVEFMAESACSGRNDDIMPHKLMAAQHPTAAATANSAFVLDNGMPETSNAEYMDNSPRSEEIEKKSECSEVLRDMECHICFKVFKNSTQSRFRFHLKWHNISKHLKCQQCKYVGSSRQALKKHIQAVHAKIYCKICGKGVLAKKLKTHMRIHDMCRKFPCEFCAEVLSSERELEAHNWQMHANRNSPVNVVDSQFSFDAEEEQQSDDSYDQVITVGIMCALCDEKFLSCSQLQHHVKLFHFKTVTQWPQIKTENVDETERIGQDMDAPSEFLSLPGTIPIKSEPSFFDNEQLKASHRAEENDVDEPISVFKGYDGEEDGYELPNNSTNMKDINTNQMYFTQNNSNNSVSYNLGDGYDQVQNGHCFSDDRGTNGIQEPDSPTYSVDDEDSDASNTLNEVSHYSCAKCTNSFGTVDELREHYKQHQVVPNNTPSPLIKPNVECHICGKKFDLKFSLNRHLKKHDEENSVNLSFN